MNQDDVHRVGLTIDAGKSLVAVAELDAAPRDRRFGWRLVFVAGTLLAYSVAELLGKALVILQLLVRAITGAPSVRLVAAGEHLSRYIYDAWRYLCFCADTPPWPLHRWQHPTTPPRPDHRRAD